jgi:hypothetical protein
MRKAFMGWVLVIALFAVVSAPVWCWARQVDPYEATKVGEGFLRQVMERHGGWGDAKDAYITGCQEFIGDGRFLGYFLPVHPRGYIMVNPLTQLSPVKAYSETSNLDITKEKGFARLLKDTMGATLEFLETNYGSLDAVPEAGIAPESNKQEWDFLLGSGPPPPVKSRATVGPLLSTSWHQQGPFKDYAPLPSVDEGDGAYDSLVTGPSLTTSWHQDTPFNDLCPMGSGGRTVVGCVATAAAQIMKYWNYPYSGTGSHSYAWSGDDSCGANVGGGNLSATFSDSYDWSNMLNSYSGGYNATQAAAVAELSYEIGVAVEMDYGRCVSLSDTMDMSTVYPTFFKYASPVGRQCRDSNQGYADCLVITGADNWFAAIRREFDNYLPRPIQYRVVGHSIVCDGYQTGVTDMVHMNYGWDSGHTAWYAVDNLHLGNPPTERMVTYIQPLNRRYIMLKGATNNNLYYGWLLDDHSFSGWGTDPGGSSTHAPAMAVFNNKQYFSVKGATNNNIYIQSKTGMGNYSGWTTTPGQTTVSPALVVFNNRLYLFVKGATNNNIYYKSMDTSGTWNAWATVPDGFLSSDSPAVTVHGNLLWVFVKGATNNNVYYKGMSDTGAWTGNYIRLNGQTATAPSVATFTNYTGQEVWLFVKGATNNNIYYCIGTPPTWDVSWAQLSGQTNKTPSLAIHERYKRPYVTVKGATNNKIYYRGYDLIEGWDHFWTEIATGGTSDTPVMNGFYYYNP